jgi:hypothetical protein
VGCERHSNEEGEHTKGAVHARVIPRGDRRSQWNHAIATDRGAVRTHDDEIVRALTYSSARAFHWRVLLHFWVPFRRSGPDNRGRSVGSYAQEIVVTIH